eukprot:1888-Eustigmatos_ZCMA.PRE.1
MAPEIAQKALLIMDFMKEMSRFSQASPAVVLFLVDFPKEFPINESFATIQYISSGACFSDYLIFVWRLEEIFKVL